jgi:hypothetical protein
MKKILNRLGARLALLRRKQKQGVAILTVLAVITLMTILVVSFFNMATTAKTTAKAGVEIQRVTTLKDTIINLVIAQFREASNLAPPNEGNPRDILTWTSQPGAIRTFSGTTPRLNRLFKLYSSNVPQLENIVPYDTPGLLELINADNEPDWDVRPDEFTDLNRPVYTAATGDRATATGAASTAGYSYPIVDPRAYNGRNNLSDLKLNTEGFSYGPKSLGVTMAGVDAAKEQLAMPVRWIYILQDGTVGYLDKSKKFASLNGSLGAEVSRENPIVGRMAWWADDESCKVNVNTASIPAAWETPRTTSLEDQWMAAYQPISGEWQRCPGHPATVDLSAVFYPNRRWTPQPLAEIISAQQNPFGGGMEELLEEDAKRIWDLAPFIVSDSRQLSSGSVGTGSGLKPTPNDSTVGTSNEDRLFTSLDEVYFKASTSASKGLDSARANLLSSGSDSELKFLRTLERSQFFLTHKSHSPELTNQGFPRVSMFPMDLDAAPWVGQTGSLPANVSPYDVSMALCSTLGGGKSTVPGGNAYFFQRRDPSSRHQENYQSTDNRKRNASVFKYLRELSKLPIPGYPDIEGFPVDAMKREDAPGLSLASKYAPGLNAEGKTYTNAKNDANNVFDSSDRTQILLNMLDFTRSINMQPAAFEDRPASRYDEGFGKAAGICGCAPGAGANTNETHFEAMSYKNQTSRSPKGTGKLYGPAEIAVVINLVGSRVGPDPAVSGGLGWDQLKNQIEATNWNRANDSKITGTRYMVEVGFVMSGFNPKMGMAVAFPQSGIAVSTIFSQGTDPTSPESIKTGNPENWLPIKLQGTTDALGILPASKFGFNSSTNPTARPLPKDSGGGGGILPLGGMGGPRLTFNPNTTNANFATARPFIFIANGPADVGATFAINPFLPVRIMNLDGPNSGDVVQAVDLLLPTDFFSGITGGTPTGKTLKTFATEWAIGAPFPDPKVSVRSFVVPHGDYRLTVTPSRVDGDVFVPVAGYGASDQAHAFYEMNNKPERRGLLSSPRWSPEGIIDILKVRDCIQPAPKGANVAKLTSLPLPDYDLSRSGGMAGFLAQDPELLTSSSMNPLRQAKFAHARRDGRGIVANRGSSDPTETGDFDTGMAGLPDGPYMNYPDEGDRRKSDSYYKKLFTTVPRRGVAQAGLEAQRFSPNFLVRSPVDFGSIPTGIAARVPWQTLRFRPDYGMNDRSKRMIKVASHVPPPGKTFANFCGPKDHFFLDMFWMPVVEPWSISEPFSTKGTINLNQQIYPFMYIERTTALHALLRGERMAAIPNVCAPRYKNVNATTGEPSSAQDPTYRHYINAKETIRQFTKRYNRGFDCDPDPPDGNKLAFNVFRSASEICELWLVPEGQSPTDKKNTLEWIIGIESPSGQPQGFWNDHLLTGDNLRERPYANLYPRVTVRSNVFKLHMVAQTLQKALSQAPETFDSTKDLITAEWRGSCLIERSIDPNDSALTDRDYTNLNASTIDKNVTPKLDRFYTYRVTELKQLTQ